MILAQASPPATTLTTIYTAPAAVTIVRLTISNRNSSAITFRICVVRSKETSANQHYIYYDFTLQGNDTFNDTDGLPLGSGDQVAVYTNTANVNFILLG